MSGDQSRIFSRPTVANAGTNKMLAREIVCGTHFLRRVTRQLLTAFALTRPDREQKACPRRGDSQTGKGAARGGARIQRSHKGASAREESLSKPAPVTRRHEARRTHLRAIDAAEVNWQAASSVSTACGVARAPLPSFSQGRIHFANISTG